MTLRKKLILAGSRRDIAQSHVILGNKKKYTGNWSESEFPSVIVPRKHLQSDVGIE